MKQARKPGRPSSNTIDVPTADKILKVASRLFIEKGFDGVSTDAVAQASGVTKAMVYYYFSSKSELFTAAVVHMMDVIRQRTLEILSRNEPLYNRLLTIATARLSAPRPNRNVEAAMHTASQMLSNEQMAKMKQAEEQLMEVITKEFEKETERMGEARVDPVVAASLFIQVMNGAEHHRNRLPEDKQAANQVAKDIVDLFWYGLSPRS